MSVKREIPSGWKGDESSLQFDALRKDVGEVKKSILIYLGRPSENFRQFTLSTLVDDLFAEHNKTFAEHNKADRAVTDTSNVLLNHLGEPLIWEGNADPDKLIDLARRAVSKASAPTEIHADPDHELEEKYENLLDTHQKTLDDLLAMQGKVLQLNNQVIGSLELLVEAMTRGIEPDFLNRLADALTSKG